MGLTSIPLIFLSFLISVNPSPKKIRKNFENYLKKIRKNFENYLKKIFEKNE